jgi:hypothetical protein
LTKAGDGILLNELAGIDSAVDVVEDGCLQLEREWVQIY